MARWRIACRHRDVKDGEPQTVKLDGVPIGVYRVDGAYHAVHDVCTHEFALLSQGYQDGGVIECPLHQARFDVTTGRCLGAPGKGDLAVFAVRLDGDDLLVALPD
jgi:nitrite reductase/ring-hydroxylating ferredoxin subunit